MKVNGIEIDSLLQVIASVLKRLSAGEQEGNRVKYKLCIIRESMSI
jgi:hypothetical protein